EPDHSVKPNPGQPAIWLRRLMIVRERSAGAEVIRDISFRLGLNIVDTPESPLKETRTVGHNVGKTLLVRLIRYVLGDHNFVSRAVRFELQQKFPEAHVLAEVVVRGRVWAVARPFVRGKPSWAVPEVGCESLLSNAATGTYDEFSWAVENATIAQLPAATLP